MPWIKGEFTDPELIKQRIEMDFNYVGTGPFGWILKLFSGPLDRCFSLQNLLTDGLISSFRFQSQLVLK